MLQHVNSAVNEPEIRGADRARDFHFANAAAEVDGGNAGGTEEGRRGKGEDSGAVEGRDAGDGGLDCGAIADGQRGQCEHAAVSLAVG